MDKRTISDMTICALMLITLLVFAWTQQLPEVWAKPIREGVVILSLAVPFINRTIRIAAKTLGSIKSFLDYMQCLEDFRKHGRDVWICGFCGYTVHYLALKKGVNHCPNCRRNGGMIEARHV